MKTIKGILQLELRKLYNLNRHLETFGNEISEASGLSITQMVERRIQILSSVVSKIEENE